MYKIKSLALIALAILFGGVFVSAEAQRRLPPASMEATMAAGTLSGSYKIAVTANELSAGVSDSTPGEAYGWTCYGTTEGALSGYMFISMDYSSAAVPPGELDSAMASEGGNVTSGSWSKLIFTDGIYSGSVHGRIVGGEVVFSPNRGDLTATISLQLIVDGGTESFTGSQGNGTFEGILDRSSKGSTVSGLLTLNF